MRRTLFGTPVFQPGDDFYANWSMIFVEEPDGEVARFLEEDDGKWGCEITDNNENSAQVNDFTSEAHLRDWLKLSQVKIED